MKKKLIVILSILIIALIAALPASADGEDYHCGMGEAMSAIQAFTVGSSVVNVDSSVKMAGLGGGVANCRVHVASALLGLPTTYTFHSSEYFAIGINWLSGYKNSEISRQEAIDGLNSIEDRIYIGPVGGPLVEVDLIYSAFKNVYRNDSVAVYQTRHYLAHLEPGEYEVYWETQPFGLSATTFINVLP